MSTGNLGSFVSRTTIMAICAATLALLPALVRAEAPVAQKDAKVPRAVTAEQLQYLEESLGEGIATADWKLIEMPIAGLKAAGRSVRNSDGSIEKAMMAAALSRLRPRDRARIDAWTAAARVRAGDPRARKRLHEWVRVTLFPLKDRKEYNAEFRLKSLRRTEALLCLAHLGDERVAGEAERVLRDEIAALTDRNLPVSLRWMILSEGLAQVRGAASALLVAGGDQAFHKISMLLNDPELTPAHKVTLLAGCGSLRPEQIAKLPAELPVKLATRYREILSTLAQRLPEDKQGRHMMINLMLYPTQQKLLPADAETLAVLEALADGLPKRDRRLFSWRVKMYRKRLETSRGTTQPPPATPTAEDVF